MSDSPAAPKNYDRALAWGAVVNVIGSIGKALIPLYFILATRLYGPEIIGVFYLTFTVLQVATSLTVSGMNDGLVMFVSRDIEQKDKEDHIYSVFANGVLFSFVIAALVIAASFMGGLELLSKKYPHPEVATSLAILVWSLPFVFIPILVTSATKALLIMKWDAILLGFLQPLLLLICSVAFYLYDASLVSLLWSYFTANLIVAVVSLYVFGMYFSYRKLLDKLIHFKVFWPLLYFSIPQNLNLTVNTFTSNFDVLILGYFSYSSEMIAFYGMGSQIVRNLRQVKLAFSTIYGPVIARLHAQKRIEEINVSFSTLSRWTSMIGFPVALFMVIFRAELLWLFHPSFATFDTSFMLLLLFVPLISITIGFSSNILVMTGHSGWNLINSAGATIINIILAFLLIPSWGLVGAAFSTAVAQLVVTPAILLQIRTLTGAKLIIAKIYKPYVAILASSLCWLALAALLGDELPAKIAAASAAFIVYGLALYLLRQEPEDKQLFSSLGKGKKQA